VFAELNTQIINPEVPDAVKVLLPYRINKLVCYHFSRKERTENNQVLKATLQTWKSVLQLVV
jgi:hypothetical protein